MTKEALKEYLKCNLSICIDVKYSFGGKGIEVSLWLENEKISNDYMITEEN